MSFYQPLSVPRDADSRRHPRQKVDFAGRVRELGSTATTGRVHDVSADGCRLTDVDLPRHAEIWVRLGVAAPRRARVIWMNAGETGCQFYAPLSPDELRDITRQRR